MLYHLLLPLAKIHGLGFLRLFGYIMFRVAMAMLTSLILCFVIGPPTIAWLTRLRFGQVVRTDGPQTHLKKSGTPTMGGMLIIMSCVVSSLLWCEWTNRYVIISVVVLIWLGALGFLDDYLKVVRRRPEGLVGRYKLIGQGLLGAIVGVYLLVFPLSPTAAANWTTVPFLAHVVITIPTLLFVPWVMFILMGTSNAVNLSDGLDGLAAGLTAIAAFTFGLFAYLIGNSKFSGYLGLTYLVGAGELTIFCMALAGSLLGFLWYNAHPAEVFMGDTGSLALGGALGIVAIMLKMEFQLVLIGGIFVLEALSVIAQVLYFKYTFRTTGTGKRLLLMAPLHHHFEKKGWAESKIFVRFWILGLFFSLLAFSTLKLR
jgi:phospho-N-acetylmuramoyl-pentapeptide-transferase